MTKLKYKRNLKIPGKNDGRRRNLKQVKRYFMAISGLTILVIFLFCAIFASLLTSYDPLKIDLSNALKAPSSDNLLGTDWLGRDVLARILYGARISLAIGFISVTIGMLIGVPVGALSGYYGGKFDLLVQRLVDMLIAFPGILLAIVIVTVLGVGVMNVMIAVGIVSIPIYVRLARGSVLAVKEQSYITAARSLGMSDARIIVRHIMPNCLSPIIVQSTFQVATAILWAAGLGFLGLGAKTPDPEWGTMLSQGRHYIRTAHHLTTYPGLAILFLVLGFNMLGDGLRDAFDPRTKKNS